MRLGILGSTRGTNLLSIIKAIESQILKAEIAVILSNKKESGILEKGEKYGIPAYFFDAANLSREDYDVKLTQCLHEHKVDIIVLVGYMRILSDVFTKQWYQKVINVHPSLLPAFAGKMDLDVHRSVLSAGEKETGCTVHFVTETLDGGPILLQKKCDVLLTDTPELLKARVQALEGQALVEAIQSLI